MVLFLWILGLYIGNIFLTRYLNLVIIKMEDLDEEPIYKLWFVPIFGPLLGLVVLVIVYLETVQPEWLRWFKGEHWKKK